MGARFAVCLDNDQYDASLIVGKIYQILPDREAEKDGYLLVIDEDGEDYLYGGEKFCRLRVPPVVAEAIILATKQG